MGTNRVFSGPLVELDSSSRIGLATLQYIRPTATAPRPCLLHPELKLKSGDRKSVMGRRLGERSWQFILCFLSLILAPPTHWQVRGPKAGKEGRLSLPWPTPSVLPWKRTRSVPCCRPGNASLHERRLNNRLSLRRHMPQGHTRDEKPLVAQN
jgi:hypothetical protein